MSIRTKLVLILIFLFFPLNINALWWNSNYNYRTCYSINTTSLTQNYTANKTTANFSFDTSILISSGKMKNDCSDLQIVYMDTITLDRHVINCNSNNTIIRHKTVKSIDYTKNSTNEYCIYYGNPSAINPPTNFNNIYWLWDNYKNQTTLNTSRWQIVSGTWSVANGFLYSISATDKQLITVDLFPPSTVFEWFGNRTKDKNGDAGFNSGNIATNGYVATYLANNAACTCNNQVCFCSCSPSCYRVLLPFDYMASGLNQETIINNLPTITNLLINQTQIASLSSTTWVTPPKVNIGWFMKGANSKIYISNSSIWEFAPSLFIFKKEETKNPNINLTMPTTSILSQSWVVINISYVNTTNIDSIILNWDGVNETNTMTCNYDKQYCFINKTSTWGNHSFYVFLNLTNSGYNQTEPTWIYLDDCGFINTNRTLYSNINASGNCMLITTDNVELDCAGYNITGINSGYGVYSTYSNTIIRNCNLNNFYSAITFNNSNGTPKIINNTLSNNWIGIELNSTSNTIISGNSFFNNIKADIISINSTNNIPPNYFNGMPAAFNYYSNDLSIKTIPPSSTLPNSFANASPFFKLNTTDSNSWVLMNISHAPGFTPESLGLYKYSSSTWTNLNAVHYTNETPNYFLFNATNFSTFVVLGCPPNRPFYWNGACYFYVFLTVSPEPQYYSIGDVITLFATLSDLSVTPSQVILYYANSNGNEYLQQPFTYDPINSRWVGSFKIRQHTEYLQIMAFNSTGSVIGYGEFYLTENKPPTWWDYFLWFFLILTILVIIFFVGKWVYETI